MTRIEWADFEKVELCVGTIIEALPFPEAKKPAYKLLIDFGVHGTKKSSAQITKLYTPEQLVGKQIIAVINFPPRQIGPFLSECLVTGFYNQNNEVVLAIPDQEIENGVKLL
jgi:tRNA-binding protein